MKRPTVPFITIVLACILLIALSAASTIQIDPSPITMQKDATATINLALDTAPSGLAGYDLVVRLSNPAVAEISEVTYPPWAVMNDTARKSDGSIRISGIDISRQIDAGMTGIPLATLRIRGISGGSSSIILESVYMDADGGSIINPATATGFVTVQGSSGSTSGGGGGGGGGGSSYQPVVTTPTQTQTAVPVLATSVPTTSAMQPTPGSTPVTTQPTEPALTVAETTTTPYADTTAFPFSILIGGIVVILVLIVAAFIAWKWDRDHE